jgi:hypothetical protein
MVDQVLFQLGRALDILLRIVNGRVDSGVTEHDKSVVMRSLWDAGRGEEIYTSASLVFLYIGFISKL